MKILLFFLVAASLGLAAQTINVKDSGIKGDGITDNSDAINVLIAKYVSSFSNNPSVLNKTLEIYFPEGTYVLSKPIKIPKLVNLTGSPNGNTILKVINADNSAIVVEEGTKKQHTEDTYNEIKNFTIIGSENDKNPFEWKDVKKSNPSNVGIRIEANRNRIKNCTISGFLGAGILIKASYYNYISDCYILRNTVGISVTDTSTTAFIANNELRYNSIGIILKDNSFGNFVSNNILESNISNLLENFTNEKDPSTNKRGIGLLLENSSNNFITNNYFEQQFVNVGLANSDSNNITSNFFAIGPLMPYPTSDGQILLKFFSPSKNNNILQNNVAASTNQVKKYQMLFNNPSADYSSNSVKFDKAATAEAIQNLKVKYGSQKFPEFLQ